MNILTFSSLNLAPDESGVYYLYNSTKEVMYIGRAINIHQRLLQHLNSDKKEKIGYFSFEKVKTGISKTEKEHIERYRQRTGNLPPLNKISGFV